MQSKVNPSMASELHKGEYRYDSRESRSSHL